MQPYRTIEIDNWHRKATYLLFKSFEQPFFNITTKINVTELVRFCKEQQYSYFLASLFAATRTANKIEEFRYRLKNDQVVCFEQVDCGSTILYEDRSFGFCYFDYYDDLATFCEAGQKALVQQKTVRNMDPRDNTLAILHFSVIPWTHFTSFQHARRFKSGDSIPKIVFGKYQQEGDQYWMPVSVEVHHALMDGYHVGLYFEQLQDWITSGMQKTV